MIKNRQVIRNGFYFIGQSGRYTKRWFLFLMISIKIEIESSFFVKENSFKLEKGNFNVNCFNNPDGFWSYLIASNLLHLRDGNNTAHMSTHKYTLRQTNYNCSLIISLSSFSGLIYVIR